MHTSSTAVVAPLAFDDWDDFDPIEYTRRNYGTLLLEDQMIIKAAIGTLKSLPAQSMMRVADVGAGPNFYPAMLLTPLVSPEGQIELIEFSKANRAFMRTLLGDSDGAYHNTNKLGKQQSYDTRQPWPKFETLIAEIGNDESFHNTFSKARRLTKSIPGSIYKLPESTYDFISSYFTAESITNNRATCIQGLTSLVRAVKPGGGFMIALVVGSDKYYAGDATCFPSVNLTPPDIREIFNNMPGVTSYVTIAANEHEKFREGYYGLALVMGTVQR